METFQLELPDEAATELFARGFAQYARPRLVVLLSGDLGAGKTTWVRAALRAWGWAGTVRSPTYTLLETYDTTAVGPVHHLDLYRLRVPEELEELGLAEFVVRARRVVHRMALAGGGISAAADLMLDWIHATSGRQVHLTASSGAGRAVLAPWAPNLKQWGAERTCQDNEQSSLSE